MKRLLTTLVILLVVIVVGLTALVMLVNPNDFRHYLVEKVAQKSGYQLAFQGDMRWHVWPTLSIITGPVSLTAEGATQPAISAENMRLDVELWPLISHHLAVEQIVLDGAVVRHTPESQPHNIVSKEPIAPSGIKTTPNQASSNQWLLDIEKVEISNSLIIWQTEKDEFNLRNINLLLKKSANKQLSIAFSGNLNKNQQELSFDAKAGIDLSQLSQQISGQISQIDYQLTGVDLPEAGISGKISANVEYLNTSPARLNLDTLMITANDSDLNGHLAATLDDIPDFKLKLSSSTLNLDSLFGTGIAMNNDGAQTTKKNEASVSENSLNSSSATRVGVKPVISGTRKEKYNLSALANFTAETHATIKTLTYRGMVVNNVIFNAVNQAPTLTVSQLSGEAFGGTFMLPVELNYAQTPAIVKAQPDFENVNLTPLLAAFELPKKLSGVLTVKGDFSGPGYDANAIKNLWQGNAALLLRNAQLSGLNIPVLIQQSLSRVTNKINAPADSGNVTQVQQLTANGQLNKGRFNLSALKATSELVVITGNGWLNLPSETLDVNLGVQITKGWGGDLRFIQQLQSISIPLRIYGSWVNLQYQLNVERLVRDELKTQAKQAIGNWLKKEEQQQLNNLLNAF